MVDVCLFGFLTSFLVVGLMVVLAPDSEVASAVLRLAGVEEAAAAPTVAARLPDPVPSEPSKLLSTEQSKPPVPVTAEPAPQEARRPTPPPARGEIRPPSKLDSSSEVREIKRFAVDADERIDAVGRGYYLEMEELGWNSILAAWHVDQDKNLRQSKAMVRQASSVVRNYEARSFQVVRELRAAIYRLPISDRSKRKLEAIVERFVIDARWGELWDLERRKIARVGEVINLLAANKRGVAWKIEDNRLLFAKSSRVLSNYNETMAELKRIAEQKLQIHRDVNSVRKKRLEEMKRLAGDG